MIWLRALLSPAAFGLGLGVWAFGIEPRRLRVRRATLYTEKWPVDRPPLRIAAISDLHVGAPHMNLAKLEHVVRTVNGLKADVVALLGDYVIHGVLFGRFVHPRPIAERLGQIQARLGVVSVLGNHDWWHDGPGIRREMERFGIQVLENDVASVGGDGPPLWIAGLADSSTRIPKAKETVSRVPEGEPVIVLAHDPAAFADVPSRAVLTLAGHTHGGQVNLSRVRHLVSLPHLLDGHGRGWVRGQGKTMFVTTGLGTSVVPLRFDTPPEIALITIRRPAQG
ncbi:MAG: metallophosphoesterase [Magnetospirillum sp. WYHS-4]